MKAKKLTITCSLLLVVLFLAAPGAAQKRSALTSAQQKELLSKRLPAMPNGGKFSSFASLLYSVLDISIHTNDKQISDSDLQSPFPSFYGPTIKELFDTIALQTNSSWSFDAQNDSWVFAKPSKPKPFSITLAQSWLATDKGVYVSYTPADISCGYGRLLLRQLFSRCAGTGSSRMEAD